MNQSEINTLINLVSTDEWQPLPLQKVAALTGKAAPRCGIVFRTCLGLPTQGLGVRHPRVGSVYIETAHGHRFARCYHRTTNESTRYWWRRFPEGASDEAVMASAKALTEGAELVAQSKAPTQAPVQTSFPLPPNVSRLPEFKPVTGLGAEIAKAVAEAEKAAQHLERLMNVRDARISQLEAELSALRSI